jgi:hypothetical protein
MAIKHRSISGSWVSCPWGEPNVMCSRTPCTMVDVFEASAAMRRLPARHLSPSEHVDRMFRSSKIYSLEIPYTQVKYARDN